MKDWWELRDFQDGRINKVIIRTRDYKVVTAIKNSLTTEHLELNSVAAGLLRQDLIHLDSWMDRIILLLPAGLPEGNWSPDNLP